MISEIKWIFFDALRTLSFLEKKDWKELAKDLEDAFPLDPAVNSVSNAIANELNEESY